jgi:hypothetical protein
MSATEPIVDALYEMAKTFEGCVVWAIRAILETDAKIRTPFKVVNSTPEGASLYCILPTGGPMFHSQLVLGVEDGDLAAIFSSEESPKVRKDALGEMANVISGLFVADDQFIAKFGYLKPSTPFFSDGAFTARKDWGIEGVVEASGKEIRLHFSIRLIEPSGTEFSRPEDKEEGKPD